MAFKDNQVIYVVDDDEALNMMICKYLKAQGFSNVKGFYTGEDLFKHAKNNENPIIIQDFDLPGMSGLDVLKKASTELNKAYFIFLSGQSSIDVAVDSIKFGAFDYIIKDSFAKENCLNKIRNLQKIKALYKAKRGFKYGFIALMILFIISWVLIFLFAEI
ncbi:MAG: response regulator [Bacteroidales bacterium]|nr:response regulator [Bacteroidales bacterium]